MTEQQPLTPTPPAPAPSTEEISTPSAPEPSFGWTSYAELINGRFAMIGFVILILIEIFTRQDLFTWLGLR